jgi:hypothetical protein
MAPSYKVNETKDNEVPISERASGESDTTRPKTPPNMVSEEFPTPQVSQLQLYVTFRGIETRYSTMRIIFLFVLDGVFVSNLPTQMLETRKNF